MATIGCPKGYHNSPETEIKPGQRMSPDTEFKKGFAPWNKGLKNAQIAWNKNLKGYKLNRINKPATKHPCLVCGKVFKAQRRIGYITRYCSQLCHGVDTLGSKSPNWKGGLRTERKKEMGRSKYKNWRVSVFERDNYSCVKCFSSATYLHADHIKSWKDFPELRYKVCNGQTLCIDCHYYKTFKRQASRETVFAWGVR